MPGGAKGGKRKRRADSLAPEDEHHPDKFLESLAGQFRFEGAPQGNVEDVIKAILLTPEAQAFYHAQANMHPGEDEDDDDLEWEWSAESSSDDDDDSDSGSDSESESDGDGPAEARVTKDAVSAGAGPAAPSDGEPQPKRIRRDNVLDLPNTSPRRMSPRRRNLPPLPTAVSNHAASSRPALKARSLMSSIAAESAKEGVMPDLDAGSAAPPPHRSRGNSRRVGATKGDDGEEEDPGMRILAEVLKETEPGELDTAHPLRMDTAQPGLVSTRTRSQVNLQDLSLDDLDYLSLELETDNPAWQQWLATLASDPFGTASDDDDLEYDHAADEQRFAAEDATFPPIQVSHAERKELESSPEKGGLPPLPPHVHPPTAAPAVSGGSGQASSNRRTSTAYKPRGVPDRKHEFLHKMPVPTPRRQLSTDEKLTLRTQYDWLFRIQLRCFCSVVGVERYASQEALCRENIIQMKDEPFYQVGGPALPGADLVDSLFERADELKTIRTTGLTMEDRSSLAAMFEKVFGSSFEPTPISDTPQSKRLIWGDPEDGLYAVGLLLYGSKLDEISNSFLPHRTKKQIANRYSNVNNAEKDAPPVVPTDEYGKRPRRRKADAAAAQKSSTLETLRSSPDLRSFTNGCLKALLAQASTTVPKAPPKRIRKRRNSKAKAEGTKGTHAANQDSRLEHVEMLEDSCSAFEANGDAGEADVQPPIDDDPPHMICEDSQLPPALDTADFEPPADEVRSPANEVPQPVSANLVHIDMCEDSMSNQHEEDVPDVEDPRAPATPTEAPGAATPTTPLSSSPAQAAPPSEFTKEDDRMILEAFARHGKQWSDGVVGSAHVSLNSFSLGEKFTLEEVRARCNVLAAFINQALW